MIRVKYKTKTKRIDVNRLCKPEIEQELQRNVTDNLKLLHTKNKNIKI